MDAATTTKITTDVRHSQRHRIRQVELLPSCTSLRGAVFCRLLSLGLAWPTDSPIALRGDTNDLSGCVRSLPVFALDLVILEIGIAPSWLTRYRRGEGHLREPVWKPLHLSHLG